MRWKSVIGVALSALVQQVADLVLGGGDAGLLGVGERHRWRRFLVDAV